MYSRNFIDEETARLAHEMNHMSDYVNGSATESYLLECEKAEELAQKQKKQVDEFYHGRIDELLSSYEKRLAENINARNRTMANCPSVLISGAGNFPVNKKRKQNDQMDRLWSEYNDVIKILDKIKTVGKGGVSSDDPDAVEKLEIQLKERTENQELMKAANKYYRKHKTMERFERLNDFTQEMAYDMVYHLDRFDVPFPSYSLSNNNAAIKRLKKRLEDLKNRSKKKWAEWEFEGGSVKADVGANRLRIYFDGKPDNDLRSKLKHNGFRWAPSVGAWQRQLTDNAYYSIRKIEEVLPDGTF